MAKALSYLRVIDLTRVRSGPTAVRQLADWGADVIKVEQPEDAFTDASRNGSDFQNLHRNKRSLSLDLKSEAGRGVFLKLVEHADVVVENFRPDVKTRLGIAYDDLKAINSRLVYASISGYGQTGPYRDRPGLDQIAQGMGGLMSITGQPDAGPMRAGIAVADMGAGLYCAIGIMTALLERERSGEGQWVHTSLLQAQIALDDFQAARWLMEREVPDRTGNDHPTMCPMGVFPTTDGHINIAPFGEPMWQKLCRVLGCAMLLDDARFRDARSRMAHREAVNEGLAEKTRLQPSAHWIELLNREGIPCGPIYRMNEVFSDGQVEHLGMAEQVEHPELGPIRLIAQPIAMSRSVGTIDSAAPTRGEHTDAILREIGYGAADIEALHANRAV